MTLHVHQTRQLILSSGVWIYWEQNSHVYTAIWDSKTKELRLQDTFELYDFIYVYIYATKTSIEAFKVVWQTVMECNGFYLHITCTTRWHTSICPIPPMTLHVHQTRQLILSSGVWIYWEQNSHVYTAIWDYIHLIILGGHSFSINRLVCWVSHKHNSTPATKQLNNRPHYTCSYWNQESAQNGSK